MEGRSLLGTLWRRQVHELQGTLLHELRRRGGRYGLSSACIGGGQGIAVIVEVH